MTDLRTAGQAAKDMVNNPNCILSEQLQKKLVDIHDKENVKTWADCVRACNRMDNQLLMGRF